MTQNQWEAAKSTQDRREAIIVFNGCFCPVHAGHVAALQKAKKHVEKLAGVRVVAGYFAVATDGYVRGKLKLNELPAWMKATARAEMCKAIAQDLDWHVSAAVFSGAPQCGKAMVATHHSKDTEVFSVRRVVKCEELREQGVGTNHEGLSSTKIRALLQVGDFRPEVVAELVDRKMLLPSVGICLQSYLKQASLPLPASQPLPKGASADAVRAADRLGAASSSSSAAAAPSATAEAVAKQTEQAEGLMFY